MVEKCNINNLDNIRGNKPKGKFKVKKDNTLKSLSEVEYFLSNWKKAIKGIRIYKILK